MRPTTVMRTSYVIQETGAAGMGSLSHPGGEKRVEEEEVVPQELVGAEATRFRAIAARANALAADRADIQYAVKEICRRMAKPVAGDWQKLVRLGRYLKGAPRCVQCYERQGEGGALTGCSDRDWAGCRQRDKHKRWACAARCALAQELEPKPGFGYAQLARCRTCDLE